MANHYIRSGEMDDPAFECSTCRCFKCCALIYFDASQSMVTLTDGSTAEATGVFMQSLTSSSGLATAMLLRLYWEQSYL